VQRLTLAVSVSHGDSGLYRLMSTLHRRRLEIVSLAYADAEDLGGRVLLEVDVGSVSADVAVAAIEREPLVETVHVVGRPRDDVSRLVAGVLQRLTDLTPGSE
jgi:hypothetical protein